jgi:amidohydrolase
MVTRILENLDNLDHRPIHIITRGGAHAWYPFFSHHHEIFNQLGSSDFLRLQQNRLKNFGHQKQSRLQAEEMTLLHQFFPDEDENFDVLHPLTMVRTMVDYWSGTVKLIFQPGEEVLPGGASLMIKQGLFEKHLIQKIFAQHVTPEIEVGKVGFKSGMFMASTDEIHITATGIGGHAALPHLYKNPIIALSKAIIQINEFYKTAKHPVETVIAFGSFVANGATNVIPNNAKALGTIRTFDENYRKEIQEKIISICDNVSKETEVKIECNIIVGYPFLMNDKFLSEKAKNNAKDFLGEVNTIDLPLRMTAEDFAFYSQIIPSCFYRIGTGNKHLGITHGVHTSKFEVDKNSLESAMALMSYLAICEMQTETINN